VLATRRLAYRYTVRAYTLVPRHDRVSWSCFVTSILLIRCSDISFLHYYYPFKHTFVIFSITSGYTQIRFQARGNSRFFPFTYTQMLCLSVWQRYSLSAESAHRASERISFAHSTRLMRSRLFSQRVWKTLLLKYRKYVVFSSEYNSIQFWSKW